MPKVDEKSIKRKKAGAPDGGQFDTHEKSDSDVFLELEGIAFGELEYEEHADRDQFGGLLSEDETLAIMDVTRAASIQLQRRFRMGNVDDMQQEAMVNILEAYHRNPARFSFSIRKMLNRGEGKSEAARVNTMLKTSFGRYLSKAVYASAVRVNDERKSRDRADYSIRRKMQNGEHLDQEEISDIYAEATRMNRKDSLNREVRSEDGESTEIGSLIGVEQNFDPHFEERADEVGVLLENVSHVKSRLWSGLSIYYDLPAVERDSLRNTNTVSTLRYGMKEAGGPRAVAGRWLSGTSTEYDDELLFAPFGKLTESEKVDVAEMLGSLTEDRSALAWNSAVSEATKRRPRIKV